MKPLRSRCRWCGVLAGWLALLGGCAPAGERVPLPTVSYVDLPRYVGTWYEIASYPHRFQKGCVATRAVYTLNADGTVGVVNECRLGRLDGSLKVVEGLARVVDANTNAKLEVSFFRPFWGSYWIIDLDPDYRWAVVGHPSRNYLWVLSRSPTLNAAVYRQIVERLPTLGYDPARLNRTLQPHE
jgi:apolipoprotein D and lipocalin family protein